MTRRIDKPDTPSDLELRACLDDGQSFIMVAGAGSGKTTSLVKALAHIEQKFGGSLRKRGQRVACITYTTVAEQEIWNDVGHDTLFHVSTIHSFLWELVKPFQPDIRTWVAQRIQEKIDELKEKNAQPRTQQKTIGKNNDKIALLDDEVAKLHTVLKFSYETASNYSQGVLGHSDIIKMVPQLIQEHALLRKITAQKYPFFFVDESQDTDPEFVGALKSIDHDASDEFCLGFFGDPMQQIYMTGIGEIALEDGWKRIPKPENFRCSRTVLATINNIRASGDALQQTIGNEAHAIDGSARLFILPADDQRDENMKKVRSWMSHANDDPNWDIDDPILGAKTLVIVHKMAAIRLGFGDLHEAFNMGGLPDKVKSGFTEGTYWALKPFLRCILPVVESYNHDNSRVMQLLREFSPRLDAELLKSVENPAAHLSLLKTDVEGLLSLFNNGGGATVGDVLEFINATQLILLDGRFQPHLPNQENQQLIDMLREINEIDFGFAGDQEKERQFMDAFLKCPVHQLFGYRKYLNDESVYSTQHGIKGTEFDRVLVVLDDEEGNYNLYSYEKLLGLKDLSDTDINNIAARSPSVLDRTLRLFYVCCSRALKDLAVVLFTANPEAAVVTLTEKGYFRPEDIKTLDSLV